MIDMELLVHVLIVIPLLGFMLSLLIPRTKEGVISQVAFWTVGTHMVLIISFIAMWAFRGFPDYNVRDLSIYHYGGFDFFFDFYFDRVSAVYLLVGTILSFLVTIYSRYYMHRESGYKRFFNTVQFFYLGYSITVLSGNFETLFIGWEILGISSFLLIAFYRGRYLPVKNGIKVFTIYRIGDVGMLLAMWMSHQLWHENITFIKLSNYDLVHEHLLAHSTVGIFVSIMILVAASAKSAQLPFSAWLPRAMEGPTPSSAIFYGSLSVHIGAFLLMRTFPFWEHQVLMRWLTAGVGLSTAVIASQIARVQTTVKSQVAYSSASQIGIIFMEIAAGFEMLALVHFAGNAFLRTYQLLISPSVVTYMIRAQFFSNELNEKPVKDGPLARLNHAAYIMALKEWHLDSVIFTLFFKPLKGFRNFLGFLSLRNLLYFLIPVYLLGIYLVYTDLQLNELTRTYLATATAFLALILVIKAYNERHSARFAWLLIISAHFLIHLAVAFNDKFDSREAAIYLSGIAASGILGYFCLFRVKRFLKKSIDLHDFHGLVYQLPGTGLFFLISALGLAGFPITTTFIGEDIVLTHIGGDQFFLAFFVALSFIIIGIALIRIYARVFLGHIPRNFQHRSDITS